MLLDQTGIMNGVEGEAWIDIAGNRQQLAEIVSWEVTAAKKKTTFMVMGSRAEHNKANGWVGTGTMTLRYGHGVPRKAMLQYIKTGKSPNISLTLVNSDPNFEKGTTTMAVSGIDIDSAIMSKADANTEILEEEVPFTYTGIEEV